MEVRRAELTDGIYSWGCNITETEWISILQDKLILKDETKSILYKFFLEPKYRSTCRKLGIKHNIDSNVVQNNIIALGKAAQKKLNRFQVIGSDKQPTYWVIPMYGELNNQALEWVIRPELVSAMEILYVYGDPSHENDLVQPKAEEQSNYSFKQSSEEKKVTNFSFDSYIALLKSSKNLVFTGIVGTGKTYLAKKIAKNMRAETQLVRLHAAYSYSDFIEGIRPATWWEDNSNHKEVLKDGVFTDFCKKALQNLQDNKKTKELLNEERSVFQTMRSFTEFIRDQIFENGEYVLNDVKANRIAIIDLNRTDFTVSQSNRKNEVILWKNMAPLYKIYKKHKNLTWSLSEIENYLRIYNHHLVFLLFLKAFDVYLEKNRIEVDDEVEQKKDFVFIIDEMNNTNISKIFGEVSSILAPEYRGPKWKIKTQHANLVPEYDLFYEGFYIPENLYIIGTTNDATSASAGIDFNTISKFTWKEIKATDRISMWDDLIPEYKKEAHRMMMSINNKIDTIPGLNKFYHIGPSYFLKLKNFQGDCEAFWDNYLEGILSQYLINQPNHEDIVAKLKKACQKQKTE